MSVEGSKGGLCLRWIQQDDVRLKSYSKNHINVEIFNE